MVELVVLVLEQTVQQQLLQTEEPEELHLMVF
jgi:hypothetical protein